MSNRSRIEVKETDQHLADNARADRAKAIAPLAHIGFTKNVIPERRLTRPPSARRANLLDAQRRLAHPARHCLARGQTDALTAHQVTHCERLKLSNFGDACDRHRQCDERSDQSTVDLLGARCRWSTGRIE